MPSPPAIFLSHNSEDKPVVREIAAALKRRRLQPWLDQDDLPPGRPWQDVAEEAIRTCQSAAVFVGKSGMGPWEREEVRALLTQAVRRGLAVIPVLLPGAPKKPELPLFLGERTWVDLRTDGVTPKGIDRLVWGITGKKPRAKSTAKPSQTGPPPLHNLPYSPFGDLLKGRDDELAENLQEDGQARVPLYGLGGRVPTSVVIVFQWILGILISFAHYTKLGLVFGFLSPLWLLPLSYGIARFIPRNTYMAYIAGGLMGGIVGAAISGAFECGVNSGFAFGAYFGSVLSGYWLEPAKQMRAISAILGTVLIIILLGVRYSDYYMHLPPYVFIETAKVVFFWCIVVIEVQLLRWLLRSIAHKS